MSIHDIFGAVSGPVYMTQRMQVEDQWEIKLRKRWGTRLTDCFIYQHLLGSWIIKDFEWQAKEFWSFSSLWGDTKYSEWGDDIKKINLAALLIRVGEVLLASAGLGDN